MTRYRISYSNPQSQFIQIEAEFEVKSNKEQIIQLPRWRPGRYEIQNFAKRIRAFKALNTQGSPLQFTKTNLSEWTILTEGNDKIKVQYEYYAALMDAGNTWLDPEQLYVNPVNCLVYIEEQRDMPCSVILDIPDEYLIATGLECSDKKLQAPSYNILVDSPFFASPTLREVKYAVNGKNYSIWFQGDMPRTDEELISDFAPFTKKTLDVIGKLPCDDYHYLNQVLPYKHYHGVEHWNSTVITIGPSDALAERERYIDFLGVSCHELFHTWNVIRLRPEEMVPYEFQEPNLHTTGFITEGITTYYGDLILGRSGVFSFEEYLNELNKLLKKHFDNEGRKNYSVAESSYDLWLDGYEKGIPGRKVSIYNEGALAALILDLTIRKKFNNEKSLDNVMQLMWERHGQGMTGYSPDDYRTAAEHIYEGDLDDYYKNILYGTEPFEHQLIDLLSEFGLAMFKSYPENSIERNYGFKINTDKLVVEIDSNSKAHEQLMFKDKVIEMKEAENGIELIVERYGKQQAVNIPVTETPYFEIYEAQLKDNISEIEKANLKAWLEECIIG